MALNASHFLANFDPKRDAYGFTVRPQHLHRYREYSTIYKEEEEERLHKWNCFLQQQTGSTVSQENARTVEPEVMEQQIKPLQQLSVEGNASGGVESVPDILEKGVPPIIQKESSEVQNWVPIRPSLSHIEDMMSYRAKKRKSMIDECITTDHNHLPLIMEESHSGEELEQAYEEEHYDSKRDASRHAPKEGSASINGVCAEPLFPWKEELEFLVHGGVPRDLRGEVWQAFVGVRTRRIERYYQGLLAAESDAGKDQDGDKSQSLEDRKGPNEISVHVPERLRKQIEKVIRCMETGLYRSLF